MHLPWYHRLRHKYYLSLMTPPPVNGPVYNAHQNAHVIPDSKLIANIFCFGALAGKISGVVYNDLTRNFPFMSIDGSISFFDMYHCKTITIMAKQVANLDDKSIFKAFNELCECLESKGYKPKMNVIDNQATKYIKKSSPKKSVICKWLSHTITG